MIKEKSEVREEIQHGEEEREEEMKWEEKKLEAVRSILFGAMMLEKVLSLYVENDQEEYQEDAVWDVWDCCWD